jgi:hypothetical protein
MRFRPRQRTSKAVYLLLLALSAPIAWAQPQPDLPLYEKFFQRIADLKQMTDKGVVRTAIVNGETVDAVVPNLNEVLGLTPAQIDLLNETALVCQRQINALSQPRSWVFDARLQQLQTGEISESHARQMAELQARRRQIVLGAIEKLKSSLPEAGIARLDAFLHSARYPDDLTLRLPKTKTLAQ